MSPRSRGRLHQSAPPASFRGFQILSAIAASAVTVTKNKMTTIIVDEVAANVVAAAII